MSDKPRKTGLGAQVFFKPPVVQQEELPPPLAEEAPAPPAPVSELATSRKAAKKTKPPEPQAEKVKTTINLSSDTLALLDALKINARRHRQKATYSDILDEAIRELAKKKGIKNSEA